MSWEKVNFISVCTISYASLAISQIFAICAFVLQEEEDGKRRGKKRKLGDIVREADAKKKFVMAKWVAGLLVNPLWTEFFFSSFFGT